MLIQDAPYHLRDFPDSSFSKNFRARAISKHPEYAVFCDEAIAIASTIASNKDATATRDLNGATQ